MFHISTTALSIFSMCCEVGVYPTFHEKKVNIRIRKVGPSDSPIKELSRLQLKLNSPSLLFQLKFIETYLHQYKQCANLQRHSQYLTCQMRGTSQNKQYVYIGINKTDTFRCIRNSVKKQGNLKWFCYSISLTQTFK